jgi:hypothetical protein
LHLAAESSSSSKVARFLAEEYPDTLHARDDLGGTTLHVGAAEYAPIEVIQLLTRMRPQALEERTERGENVLHCAAGRPDAKLEVVLFLAAKRPQLLHEVYKCGQHPLRRAIICGAPLPVIKSLAIEAPETLREGPKGTSALHPAIVRAPPNLDMVKWFVSEDPFVLASPEMNGLLPIHHAVRSSTLEVVQAPTRLRSRSKRTTGRCLCTS